MGAFWGVAEELGEPAGASDVFTEEPLTSPEATVAGASCAISVEPEEATLSTAVLTAKAPAPAAKTPTMEIVVASEVLMVFSNMSGGHHLLYESHFSVLVRENPRFVKDFGTAGNDSLS